MNFDTIFLLAAKILALVVLVFLNGFFVAAEFALVKLRQSELTSLVRKGHRRAKVARNLLRHLDRYLSAAQLGITLASLGLGWVGEPVFTALLQEPMRWFHVRSPEAQHSIAFLVGFTVLTFLHITAGEQAPKWLAIQKPLSTSLWVAIPLHLFYRLTYPFIWLLNQFSLWLLRGIGIQPASDAERVQSEEELRLLLASSQKGAAGLGRNLVLNALDLRRRIAREVMRPRHEIVALDTQMTMAQCLDVAEKSRFSRFPLCEAGDLDRTLGVVHIKDLYAMRLKATTAANLTPVAHKLIYVPENARLEKLLHLLLDRKTHFAIVVDEYGGTVGLITLENILEELVGQIQDEFDQEKPPLVRIDENTWQLMGSLPLHELSEVIGESLHGEGISTTSGWVTQRLGGFAKPGDVLPLGSFELRVDEMDGPRVASLSLKRIHQESPTNPSDLS